MIIGVGIYLSLGVVCFLITVFGFKFPPRGSDAIMKSFIMVHHLPAAVVGNHRREKQ